MLASWPSRRGFTLTELMVAVLVLIVVIVATSKIFGTASRVTGLGQAGSEVLQEATAIERRMRADFEGLSREGFFSIRCVAVRNSVNLAKGGPLLDPGLPPGAWIRADQIVFFTQGVQSVQGFRAAAGIQRKGQATAARVYYGHAFQVPQGPPAEVEPDGTVTYAIDPKIDSGDPLVPWYLDEPPFRDFQKVRFQRSASAAPGDYVSSLPYGLVNVTQPPALQWLLARQSVVLVDDGGDPATGGTNVYLAIGGTGGVRSTSWINNGVIINGRVDASAARFGNDQRSGLGEIRARVMDIGGDGTIDAWPDQRNAIGNLVFYPRAERYAPSMNRVDQALTSHTLSGACSSFAVDWTYADGVGSAVNPNTFTYPGVQIKNVTLEQPWFGLDPGDGGNYGPIGPRGVRTYANYVTFDMGVLPQFQTVFPASVESVYPALSTAGNVIGASSTDIIVYEAFFGYNQDHPLDANGRQWGFPAPPAASPAAYTPWPSAVRVTMTLHDPAGKLAVGRVVQLVFELPRRN